MACEQSGAGSQHKNVSLTVSKVSHKIRKPDSEPPAVHRKRPVIVRIFSPKVIQTDPGNFMWLVQSLTGSSDTRSRCRRSKLIPATSDEASDLTAVAKNDKSHSDTSDGSSGCSEKLPIVQFSNGTISSSSGRNCRATHYSRLDAAVAMAERSAKDLVSPKRPPFLVAYDSLFSIPPVLAFDSSCFNLNYQVSQQSLLSSLHLPNFPIPDALNEQLINYSCLGWNPGRYLSPFKGSSSSIPNLLSQCSLRQPSTWDGRINEQLSSNDEGLYDVEERCVADTVFTRRRSS